MHWPEFPLWKGQIAPVFFEKHKILINVTRVLISFMKCQNLDLANWADFFKICFKVVE